jgi:hypothetical protein
MGTAIEGLRPMIIWNAIAVCINFITVGAYAFFVHKEKQRAASN